MKLNKYIGLAIMPMLLAACQEDALVNGIQDNTGISTLSGTMANGAVMSRAQVTLGNSDSGKESFLWNEGDEFALYQIENDVLSTHVFTISSDYSETGEGDKKSATFYTDTPAKAANFVAIYPANKEVNENEYSVNLEFERYLNFEGATTPETRNDVWKEYLKKNMFMMATGELIGDQQNTVSFEHLCALARITYTNSTDQAQTIQGIALGEQQTFGTSKKYELKSGFCEGGSCSSSYQLLTNGLTIEAGETTDFYMLFYPEEFIDGVMRLTIMEKGYVELATSEIADANGGATGFEAGKRYWFKVTEYDNGMVWSKDFTTEVATIENPLLAIALQDKLGADIVTLDEDSMASISVMDARAVKTLYLDPWKLDSLDGIEVFSNLETLNVDNTGLSGSFDASVLPKLRWLSVSYNNLTSFNLKGCSELIFVGCDENQLTELDLSDLEKLETLYCKGNLLTSLDVSACKYMTNLECEDNLLTELDLTMMVNECGLLRLGGQGQTTSDNLTITVKMTDAWKDVWYTMVDNSYNSYRVVIDGEVTPAQDEFMISSKGFANALFNVLGEEKVTMTESGRAIMKREVAAGITSLDLKGQTGVTSLAGIDYFVNLEQLYADGVGLEGSYDFKKIPTMKHLDLSNNPGIENIYVNNNPNLTHLFLVSSPIYDLDVTQNANLESLLVVNSNIQELNVGNNHKLVHLNCRENRMGNLDVTRNGLLTQLYCGGQREDIIMHLTMTSAQKTWWDEDGYATTWENTNVEITVKEMIGEGNGSLGNFGSGGEF